MPDIETTTRNDFIVVTEENAAALITILLERGYFHKKDTTTDETIQNDSYHWNDATFPTPPSFGRTIPKYDVHDSDLIAVKQSGTSDAASSPPSSYMTLQKLLTDFCHELDRRGRWSIGDASEHFGVQESVIRQRILPLMLCKKETSEEQYVTITSSVTNCEIKEIITSNYLQTMMDELWKKLQSKCGYLSIADVSQKELQIPLDLTEKIIEQYIQKQSAAKTDNDHDATVKLMLSDHGSKVLVAHSYLDKLKSEIRQICLDATESIHLNEIATEKGWELGWVSKLTADLHDDLPGIFKKEGATTAIYYIPNTYVDRQRHKILDFYHANGYITTHIAQSRFGVSGTEMKHILLSSKDDLSMPTMALQESIINPDVIVANLTEAVREAVENHSWLDSTILHVPPEIIEHHTDDARALFDHVLIQLDERAGAAVVRKNGVFFFSQGMIGDFKKSHLTSIVESTAEELAQRIFHSNENCVPPKSCLIEEEDIPQSGKEKRKARKAKKHPSSEMDAHETRETCGSLPLTTIRNKLVEVDPSLMKLDASGRESVLDDLCKLVFCTEDLDILYQKSVQRHLDLFEAAKKTSTITKKEVVIEDFPSIEAAFEDPSCFATACYTVQALYKFLTYATQSDFLDSAAKDSLQRDFLVGVCADFTSRLTQFALFKNNVSEHELMFHADDSGLESHPFYHPIDLAARSYNHVYLSSKKGGPGGKNDPLPFLRDVLPGNVGVAIARQWILCGGETYQGGTKPSSEENGESYTRPGDVEGFLRHVKENCLTICGIPFTNLDKKAEKRYLNARRQRLMSCLEAASDASNALDLTIMLLYQLVKNFVVAGNLLRGSVLQLLVRERKVSEETAKELLAFAAKLDEGKLIDKLQIDQIKGLAKSKV